MGKKNSTSHVVEHANIVAHVSTDHPQCLQRRFKVNEIFPNTFEKVGSSEVFLISIAGTTWSGLHKVQLKVNQSWTGEGRFSPEFGEMQRLSGGAKPECGKQR